MSVDWEGLFEQLLRSEHEADVTRVLNKQRLLADELWVPVGGNENNFSVIGNQQTDATGALVEKIINAIDARLLLGCYLASFSAPDQADGGPTTRSDGS